MDSDDIVVTGIAVWSCFGRGVPALNRAIAAGASGLAKVRGFPTDDPWYLTDRAMQIPPDGAPPLEWPHFVAVETAGDALRAARLERGRGYPPRRVGVLNGSSHGSNHLLLEYLGQRAAGRAGAPELLSLGAMWVARRIAVIADARGPNITLSTACSSGLNSVGQAASLIRDGEIDCAVAGGNDAFSFLSFAGFNSLHALDPKGTRPFDRDRDGLSLGDGAAYCVLERRGAAARRGGEALATITGYACAAEGYHPTAPDPEGRAAFDVMLRAIEADPRPRDLDFVSAHGTGTKANDGAEAAAIGRLVARIGIEHDVDVASLKSQTGHGLGAAGAMQIVSTIGAMREGLVPGTCSLGTPIEHRPPLRFPRAARRGAIRLALCNSFGFGGSVGSLSLRADPGRGSET